MHGDQPLLRHQLRFESDLQGVEVARHHVPKSDRAGEFDDIALADDFVDLAEEVVIDSRVQRQLLRVTKNQLVIVVEARAGLVRADVIDLLLGKADPLRDRDVTDETVLAIETLHQHQHGKLARPLGERRLIHKIIREREDLRREPGTVGKRLGDVRNAAHTELRFETIVEFLDIRIRGLFFDIRNSWHMIRLLLRQI